MMAALTLLANHEPAYTATLRELAHHAIEEGFGSGWVLLQGLLHECEGKPPQGTSPEQATTPLIGMTGVWLALLRHWRSDTEDSERGQQRLEIFREQLATRGYHRLEKDIADLLHQQYRQPAPPLPHPLSALYRAQGVMGIRPGRPEPADGGGKRQYIPHSLVFDPASLRADAGAPGTKIQPGRLDQRAPLDVEYPPAPAERLVRRRRAATFPDTHHHRITVA